MSNDILEYGIESHNTWKEQTGPLEDPNKPWKFDYSSDGDPLVFMILGTTNFILMN